MLQGLMLAWALFVVCCGHLFGAAVMSPECFVPDSRITLLSCDVSHFCPMLCSNLLSFRGRGGRGRHAHAEDDEDAELLQDEENDGASNQVCEKV